MTGVSLQEEVFSIILTPLPPPADVSSVAVSPAGDRKGRTKDRRGVSLSSEKILEGKHNTETKLN